MKENNKEKGDLGEKIACEYLKKEGYAIRHTQWRSGHLELDIVAQHHDTIVFVEVKMRYTDSFGEPWEAVNKTKRKKVIQAADAYMVQLDLGNDARFDIISILMLGNKPEVQHIEEAFYPTT